MLTVGTGHTTGAHFISICHTFEMNTENCRNGKYAIVKFDEILSFRIISLSPFV